MDPQPSSQWDLGRFLATLTYFDAFPLADVFRQVQHWLAGRPEQVEYIPPNLARILLAGHNAQSLAEHLRRQNLVVQTSTEDWTRIRAVVYVLGSAADLAELAELAERAQAHWRSEPERMIFDFRHPTPALQELWGALDDVVMGGISQSALQLREGLGRFAGTISTANSGGFASIRTRNFSDPLDLSGLDGIELRLQGDGQRYKLFVRTETGWDSPAYSTSFDTEADVWTTVRLPFAKMQPVFRAKTLKDMPALDAKRIRSLQLMLSKFEQDGLLNPHFRPGSFALQIAWIGAYRSGSRFIVLADAAREYLDAAEEILDSQQLSYALFAEGKLIRAGADSLEMCLQELGAGS